MARLPKLPYRLTRSRPTQLAFGVLNHTATAADGEIYDERDVSTEEYPALTPRKSRLKAPSTISLVENSRIGSDGARLFWHSGGGLYYGGKLVGGLPLGDGVSRRFACMGERIVIWPDKVCYDSEAGRMTAFGTKLTTNATLTHEYATNYQYLTVSDGGVDLTAYFAAGDSFVLGFRRESLRDLEGTYQAVKVTAKVITLATGSLPRVGVSGNATIEAVKSGTDGTHWAGSVFLTVTAEHEINRDVLTFDTAESLTGLFKAGDAVLLNKNPLKSYAVEAVTARALYFAEGTLSGVTAYGGTVLGCTVSSEPPELDHFTVCDNRVFGCRGSEIYASKLGDPAQWYYWHAPALSTDSWYLDTGDPSPFTACCVYGGRPHFFTERSVTVLYGDSPAQYSTATVELYGVKAGSADSLVAVGGALYYLSPQGFVRYTSSEGAVVISDRLGSVFASACAGTDGRCYYACVLDPLGQAANYKYSLKSGLWAKEDGRRFYSFASLPDRLFALSSHDGSDERCIMLISGGYNTVGENVDGVGFLSYADPPSMEVVLAPLREDRSEGVALRPRWVQKLYLRLIRSRGAEVSVSVLFDGGEEREVLRLSGIAPLYDAPEAKLGREEVVQIPLPNNKCDTYRIVIRATGTSGTVVKLLGMTREHYSFR